MQGDELAKLVWKMAKTPLSDSTQGVALANSYRQVPPVPRLALSPSGLSERGLWRGLW